MHNGLKVMFTITGNSMEPFLHHRESKVCVVKPDEKPPGKYDIILFIRRNGKYILHRIVSVRKDGYVVIGDNQYVKDEVLPSQVIGVVSGFWRGKIYTACDNILYKLYSRFWVFVYPIRLVYFRGSKYFLRIRKVITHHTTAHFNGAGYICRLVARDWRKRG